MFAEIGAAPSEFRRKRSIAITMLATWATVAMMQKVATARIGAVIAPTFSLAP